MQEYVIAKNIDRFRDLLGKEADEAKRRVLTGLLADEEAKLAGIRERGESKATKPASR